MDSRGDVDGASRFWVTCYTDASFTPTAAGWGVWLRSARGRIVRHGPCPAYVSSANEAEMAAIFAGVYLARKAWGAAVRGLVVYTDSQAAVGFLSGEALKARTQQTAPGIARLRERIRAFSGEHGIELDLRWVKGHQKTNTVRAYLNARCDELAGAARIAAERGGGKKKTAPAEKKKRAKAKAKAKRRAVLEKTSGTPNAGKPAAPAAEGPPRPSRKQRERARRLRARERKRAKKAARAQALLPGTTDGEPREPGPDDVRSRPMIIRKQRL